MLLLLVLLILLLLQVLLLHDLDTHSVHQSIVVGGCHGKGQTHVGHGRVLILVAFRNDRHAR